MGLSPLKKGKYGLGFKYSSKHYGKSLVVLLILILLTMMIMQPIALVFSIHETWTNEPMVRDILDMTADFIKRVAQAIDPNSDYMVWSNVFRQIVYIIFMMGILPLVIITMAFGFYSEREKTEAYGLRKEFEKFGKRSRIKETSVD